MSQRAVLEVIALDVEDAVAAQAGGADRLELVTDMAADGLTPTVATFAGIRAAVDIPLRVMLRLADGFAVGDVDRLVGMAGELRAAGAEEFVLGFLGPDGAVDLDAVERVVAALDGCRWTFHRAIDRAADRDALRKQLYGMPGLDTYLTAGAATGVEEGLPTLLAEARRGGEPGYEQTILVGEACDSNMWLSFGAPGSMRSTSAGLLGRRAGESRFRRGLWGSGGGSGSGVRWVRGCQFLAQGGL